jgi:hypothetical protein
MSATKVGGAFLFLGCLFVVRRGRKAIISRDRSLLFLLLNRRKVSCAGIILIALYDRKNQVLRTWVELHQLQWGQSC